VLELEPLLQCNLACAGCGKIQHPDEILPDSMQSSKC
jgi:MoaA/NifB/PqqE/SkfB family radical SAM enzyme